MWPVTLGCWSWDTPWRRGFTSPSHSSHTQRPLMTPRGTLKFPIYLVCMFFVAVGGCWSHLDNTPSYINKNSHDSQTNEFLRLPCWSGGRGCGCRLPFLPLVNQHLVWALIVNSFPITRRVCWYYKDPNVFHDNREQREGDNGLNDCNTNCTYRPGLRV